MAKRLIYVGPEDDVSDLAGKMQAADPGDEVALVVPPGAQAFQSPLNVRLLRSVGARRGLTASVVSPDPRIQELARSVGVSAYASVAAYEGGVPLSARPNAPAYRAGVGPTPAPRPQPPFLPRGAASVPGPVGGGNGLGATPGTPLQAPPATPLGPWTAPGGPQDPWDAPAGPLRPRVPPVLDAAGVAPVATPTPGTPFTPRPGTQWSPGPEASDWEEPAPPWAAGRSRDPFEPGVAGTVLGARQPGYPPPPPVPPGRGPMPSRLPAPAQSRTRTLLQNRTAMIFIAIAVVVIGLIAFLVLSPSALVSVTVAEQPLTVTPTIQGATTAPTSGTSNFVQSMVVTDGPSASTSQSFQASPSGTQPVPATFATGNVVVTANSGADLSYPYTASSPLIFQTATAIEFETTGTGQVFLYPGNDSTAPISVQAVAEGATGDVAQEAIDTWVNDPCTSSGCGVYGTATSVTVANSAATTGGTNATTETVADASDVATWQDEVSQSETALTEAADADLAAKAGQDKPAIDPNGDGRTVSFTISPTSFSTVAANTVMTAETVTVTMTASETVYNPAAVQAIVLADLEKSTNLPSGDTLIASQLQLKNLQVIQSGSDGTFAMSVTGVDYYHPVAVSLTQLQSQLTGHSPGDVATLVEQQIPDVQSVSVHISPVQLFFMPLFSSNIKIVETYVTPAGGSSSSGG